MSRRISAGIRSGDSCCRCWNRTTIRTLKSSAMPPRKPRTGSRIVAAPMPTCGGTSSRSPTSSLPMPCAGPDRHPCGSHDAHGEQPPPGLRPQACSCAGHLSRLLRHDGAHDIDYRFTDRYLDPPDQAERFYSEESVRLPETYWCYRPIAGMPGVCDLPALSGGGPTFGCLNNFCKVTLPTLAAWSRLLQVVPKSQLLLPLARQPP